MSLKAFHLFFIGVSVVFLAGFGFWGGSQFRATGDVLSLALGIGSGVASLVLVVYGRWFLRKLKHVSYL